MSPKSPVAKLIAAVALCAALTGLPYGVALADEDAEIRKHPGYVDFGLVSLFAGQEASIEIHLRSSMLGLISKFTKNEDPELHDVLQNLKLVHVQVYDITDEIAREASKITSETAKRLDDKGWERIVRVREDDESVDIYLKPSEEYEWLDGLVVMVIGDDGEAVFVNIVGRVHPDDIARLGEQFEIEHLEDIDVKKRRTR